MNNDDLILIEPQLVSKEIIPMDERKIMLSQKLSLGYKVKEIARDLRVSEAWVREHRKDPGVRSFVKSLQEEAIDSAKHIMGNGTVKAANTILGLMDCGNDGIRLAAARDFLDRMGLNVSKQAPSGPTLNISFNNLSIEERKSNILDRLRVIHTDD